MADPHSQLALVDAARDIGRGKNGTIEVTVSMKG
jgi:hypothetical protein